MARHYFIFGILYGSFWCQAIGQPIKEGQDLFYGHGVAEIIDSLRQSVLADTAKFCQEDVRRRAGITENIYGYSPLFIINDKYYYRLDVAAPVLVKEFVKEYLVPGRIKLVNILSSDDALIYGSNGRFGVILIKTIEGLSLNPGVAGFKGEEDKGGSNYYVSAASRK